MSNPPPDRVSPHEKTTIPLPDQDAAATLSEGPSVSSDSGTSAHAPGDYEVLTELGRGGMGVVYKAVQRSLNRTLAVKMLLPNAVAGTGDLQRFRTEVEATACLQHPNIVRVYEVGEADGRPYYSMDYIDGPSLSQRLTDGPLPGKDAARYLVAVAQAMQHAHDHGILHRDLKPSNILLDGSDRPHVTDFGLAKRLGVNSGQTATGQVLGTPSYMSPEQASGSKELSPAADIYGLGAVLYALMTGRPPFRAETSLETVRQVVELEPAPPRLLNPNIDRDLETICLKCLNKAPGQRYGSAREFAADLERYLAGEPINARSVNLLDRLARTLERSGQDTEFRTWGNLLLLTAAIILVCHSAVFIAAWWDLPLWYRWVAGTLQFVLVGIAFLRHRPGRILPTSAAERQLWSIWIGYLIGFATTAVISLQTADREVLGRLLSGLPPGGQLSLYPYSAVLAGLAFFVMGSNYWGGCYVIGVAFFVLAALMPVNFTWVPLEFAALWAGSLSLLGVRLRRMGPAAGRETGG
jgi:serine/threonine protein kinase